MTFLIVLLETHRTRHCVFDDRWLVWRIRWLLVKRFQQLEWWIWHSWDCSCGPYFPHCSSNVHLDFLRSLRDSITVGSRVLIDLVRPGCFVSWVAVELGWFCKLVLSLLCLEFSYVTGLSFPAILWVLWLVTAALITATGCAESFDGDEITCVRTHSP